MNRQTDVLTAIEYPFTGHGLVVVDYQDVGYLDRNGRWYVGRRVVEVRQYRKLELDERLPKERIRRVNGVPCEMTEWKPSNHVGCVVSVIKGERCFVIAKEGVVVNVRYMDPRGPQRIRHEPLRQECMQLAAAMHGLRMPEVIGPDVDEISDARVADRIAATIAPQPAPKVARKQRRGEGKPPRGQQSRPRPEYVSDPSFGGGPMQEAFMKLLHGAGTADRLH